MKGDRVVGVVKEGRTGLPSGFRLPIGDRNVGMPVPKHTEGKSSAAKPTRIDRGQVMHGDRQVDLGGGGAGASNAAGGAFQAGQVPAFDGVLGYQIGIREKVLGNLKCLGIRPGRVFIVIQYDGCSRSAVGGHILICREAEVLGVFTVCLGKEVIWNFPRQFVNEETVYSDGGNQYSFGVRDLNELLRDYLDTPREELLKKKFPRDYFGVTNILKAADRRVGVDRLQKHFKDCEQESVMKVLSARLAPHQGST